jgi:hypothetical protein
MRLCGSEKIHASVARANKLIPQDDSCAGGEWRSRENQRIFALEQIRSGTPGRHCCWMPRISNIIGTATLFNRPRALFSYCCSTCQSLAVVMLTAALLQCHCSFLQQLAS